jgi:hypothetical protein
LQLILAFERARVLIEIIAGFTLFFVPVIEAL